MVIAIRVCEYTQCQVVEIVYYGNGDISMWFCYVRAFLVVKSYFH